MKTLIISLNSKYIHSALAPWYLKAACNGCGEVKIKEFTINDNQDAVLSAIFVEKPDVAAFSCYIWNIGYILKLADSLKKLIPGLVIVLGGPEVSFDSDDVITNNSFVDYVIAGEGEEAFKLFLEEVYSGKNSFSGIHGLFYRKDGTVAEMESCKYAIVENLEAIPSPYNHEMLEAIGNRIVYFETSRGCPFSCSYCLSSTFDGVRYFSMERIKTDLKFLITAGVRQVKFVDRTFNAHRERAKEIIAFIIDSSFEIDTGSNNFTNFHFEAAADLFDDELIKILETAKPGLIQLEIGVQTTNPVTLEAINRKTDLKKVFYNVSRLMELGNIHIHLDLIAGLPFEDYQSFKDSFNEVYLLKPHQLQLGFLKLLKGSEIRRQAGFHSYEFRTYPPYEILSSKYIGFNEIIELKGIEELVERYYNSSRFVNSFNYLTSSFFQNPYDLFRQFYVFSRDRGYLERPLSSRQCYTVLLEFLTEKLPQQILKHVKELLKFDYLVSDNSNNLPEGMERIFLPNFNERCFEFLKSEKNILEFLPSYKGLPAKKIFKDVHFEVFEGNVPFGNVKEEDSKWIILFDYNKRDRVTGLYHHINIPYLK